MARETKTTVTLAAFCSALAVFFVWPAVCSADEPAINRPAALFEAIQNTEAQSEPGGEWALFGLFAVALGLIYSIAGVYSCYKKQCDHGYGLLSLGIAAACALLYFLTNDMSGEMVLANWWSLLTFGLTVSVIVFAFRATRGMDPVPPPK